MLAKVVLPLVALFSFSAFADLSSDISARFNLSPGGYHEVQGIDHVSGTDKCQEGVLRIFEREQGLTYDLSGNPIVEGVALHQLTNNDGDCISTYQTAFVNKSLVATKRELCKNDPALTMVTTMTLTRRGFIYLKVVREGSRTVMNEKCTLERD